MGEVLFIFADLRHDFCTIVSNERFWFKIMLLRHAQPRKPKNEALLYSFIANEEVRYSRGFTLRHATIRLQLMRHATIQIHLLRHATITIHPMRHATIQMRHATIQTHQMRYATIQNCPKWGTLSTNCWFWGHPLFGEFQRRSALSRWRQLRSIAKSH